MPSFLYFSVSFLTAFAMIVEGYSIVLMKKQITPIPTRILYWIAVPVVGAEKSRSQFLNMPSSKDLHIYAWAVLFFGPILLISSVFYAFTVI